MTDYQLKSELQGINQDILNRKVEFKNKIMIFLKNRLATTYILIIKESISILKISGKINLAKPGALNN